MAGSEPEKVNLENNSSDENISELESSSITKIKRISRKVNWTPFSEKSPLNSFAVNYHHKANKNHRNVQSSLKKREAWGKMVTAITTKRKASQDEDDIPNLERFFKLSSAQMEEKPNANSKPYDDQVIAMPIQLEFFSESAKQVESCSNNTKTFKIAHKPEIITISDDEDHEHAHGTKTQDYNKNTQTSHAVFCFNSTNSEAACACCSKKANVSVAVKPADLNNNTLPCISSSDSSQRLKIKPQVQNTFKQRQLELHRQRIAVEQKRLELLEMKLARERDEMAREQILFEKELALKSSLLGELTSDKDGL